MCVYVRRLTYAESGRLTRWLRQSKSVVKLRRAQVIAFSGQGMKAPQIARQLKLHPEYVRELIRRFNEDGFRALAPKPRTGRAPALSEEEKALIVEVATAPPQAFGRPFNQWSLRKLHRFLVVDREFISPVSVGTIRNVLKARGVSYQRTRTWKRSNDPDYDAKKNESQTSTGRRRKAAR
jgi:transposase